MSLFFLAPVTQVVGVILMILLIIYDIFDIRIGDIFAFLFAYRYLFFILSYIVSVLIAIFIVRYNKKQVKESISGIIAFPIFLITWIPINIVCLFTKKIKWEPIKHTRDISIDNITSD